MSYRRFMIGCVVCVLCVEELDHADLKPMWRRDEISCELAETNSILVPYTILDKSLVFTN